MNEFLENKSREESASLEVQDSNLIVNKSSNSVSSAHMMVRKSYGEILPETNNSKKEAGVDRNSTKRKDTAPRLQVSVGFAAKQWFRILLVHLNGKNDKYKDTIEPLPSAICV